jgi:hypothetical protein
MHVLPLLLAFREVALGFPLGVVLALLDPLREAALMLVLLGLSRLHPASSFDAPSVPSPSRS